MDVLHGATGFTPVEKAAQVAHWRGVGHGLGVRELPRTWEEMECFLTWYEASPEWFGPTPEASRCTNALIEQFSNRWLPRPLRWVGRPLLLSLHDAHTLRAIGQHKPPWLAVWLVRRLARAGVFLNRSLLPDRSDLLDLTTLVAGLSAPRV